MALAAPERVRVSIADDDGTGTSIRLPARRVWPVALVVGLMFLIFAAVEVTVIRSMFGRHTGSVFDVMALLFQGFWVLGWSVGVVLLLLLTVFLFSFRESLRVAGPRLTQTTHVGPLKIFSEYDLASIRDLRVEPIASSDLAHIRFEYNGGSKTLGQEMPRAGAEECVRTIEAAMARAERRGPQALEREDVPATNGFDVSQWLAKRGVRMVTQTAAVKPSVSSRPATASASMSRPVDSSERGLSSLVLIGANLIPLLGVLFLGWSLSDIMVLFWAENAIIGFYNLLKIGVVARWGALFTGPFFVGHYGGFMAAHFLFIYYFFVRGIAAGGAEPPALAAMAQLFVPLWPALLAMFISHGVSFVTNFLGDKEYVGRSVGGQMGEPYKRIVILQLTIIFGGWMVMLLKSSLPALVILVAIKTVVDLSAHERERRNAAAISK